MSLNHPAECLRLGVFVTYEYTPAPITTMLFTPTQNVFSLHLSLCIEKAMSRSHLRV
jgi:hypothetical protein